MLAAPRLLAWRPARLPVLEASVAVEGENLGDDVGPQVERDASGGGRQGLRPARWRGGPGGAAGASGGGGPASCEQGRTHAGEVAEYCLVLGTGVGPAEGPAEAALQSVLWLRGPALCKGCTGPGEVVPGGSCRFLAPATQDCQSIPRAAIIQGMTFKPTVFIMRVYASLGELSSNTTSKHSPNHSSSQAAHNGYRNQHLPNGSSCKPTRCTAPCSPIAPCTLIALLV